MLLIFQKKNLFQIWKETRNSFPVSFHSFLEIRSYMLYIKNILYQIWW